MLLPSNSKTFELKVNAFFSNHGTICQIKSQRLEVYQFINNVISRSAIFWVLDIFMYFSICDLFNNDVETDVKPC